ncbi:MAG: response regulator [Ferruginibacter sp.]
MTPKLNCILLIDDDEATNFLSNIILEETALSNNIKTKQTARSALAYLADSVEKNDASSVLPYPDLILLDINMPAMDGWEFIERFRELNRKADNKVIIVMLTTSINPDDKIRALNMPEISSFENKPLTTEMVTSIVERFFPL